MKKLLIILCFLPMFSFGSTPYKILADTIFIGSIPYRTATGELLLFNATKDTTESVLYNIGSGKTEFKKVRLIRLNDSTYVFKIGTTVIGDSIKIHSGGSGGGGSGTVTDFIFTNGNGFDGTVSNSTTTPTLSLVGDTIYKFASVDRVLDSLIDINERIIEAQRLFPNGINFISSDYELQTSDEGKIIYSTTPNVNITMPASVIFEGGKNIGLYLINGGTFQRTSSDSAIQVLPFIGGSILDSLSDKQGEFLILYTLSVGDGGNSQLLTVSAGILEDNGVLKTVDKYLYDKIATKVDTAYLFRNATLDSTCLIVTINGLSYRTCAKDSVGSGGGSSDFVLISTATASSSATVDFTGLTSTYSSYKVIVSGVYPATNNAVLWMRIGTGGTPTYQSGASDYAYVSSPIPFAQIGGPVGSVGGYGSVADTKIVLSNPIKNAVLRPYNAEIRFYDPAQSASYHNIRAEACAWDTDTYLEGFFLNASYLSATSITAIRFLMSTGNIAGGTFKLYGIK